MEAEIMQLDQAMEKDVFVGDSEVAEKKWKAVYNIDTDKVAAIVCKDYEIVQHRAVAESFLEACRNLNIKYATKVKNQHNRIFIDVTFPDSKLYAEKGEEFIAGFRLINSYDKTTGVIIVPRLVRLVCMNGMVVDVKGFVKTFNYRHNQEIAKNFGGYIEIALKETIDANDKLKAMVNSCLGDSAEWQIVEKLMEVLIHVKKHYEPMIALMKKQYDEVGNLTRWDIYNAITQYATHGEQLKPNTEMLLQRKAQKVLTTPMVQLVEIIPKQ